MPIYRDVDNDSNVKRYKLVKRGLRVTFKDGKSYLYTDKKEVLVMAKLAKAGDGLNGYININQPKFR